jgi:RecB family exonuclease
VPSGAIAARAVESPTGIQAILQCPLSWVLNYAAGMRARGPARLPDIDQMIGTFLHEVLRHLFAPGAAAMSAASAFDQLLPQYAAPLQRPELAAVLARTKGQFLRAKAYLDTEMQRTGLRVTKVEEAFADCLSPVHTQKLAGRIDMLLESAALPTVVLDSKWTRRDGRLRQTLAAGESVQLAAYAWLAGPRPQPVDAGYFLLRQSELVTAHGAIGGPATAGSSLAASWQRVADSYGRAFGVVASGDIAATGVSPSVAGMPGDLQIEPPCRYCDYRTLCGAEGA